MTSLDMIRKLLNATSALYDLLDSIKERTPQCVCDEQINSAFIKIAEVQYDVFTIISKAIDKTKGQQPE